MNAKAKWVADLMAADGITPEFFANLGSDDQLNFIMAYMDAIGRKIGNMQAQYLCKPEVKEGFSEIVFDLVSAGLETEIA
jgi:hypothetical protein